MNELLAELARRLPADPTELLSADEHRQLAADLAAMAKQRRDAEVESRDVPIGSER